jgi:hypothetical protein
MGLRSSSRRKDGIALGLLEQAVAQDIPRGFVPAEAG